jgi:hypothetical protein
MENSDFWPLSLAFGATKFPHVPLSLLIAIKDLQEEQAEINYYSSWHHFM